MSLPEGSKKQRHQDRHRKFISGKFQLDLSHIMEMRFDPMFTTTITSRDIDNQQFIQSEWARYQECLQVKAALLASVESFSTTIDAKSVPPGEPATTCVQEVIPVPDDVFPSFVRFSHTHDHGLENFVYGYPDQKSLDRRCEEVEPTEIAPIVEDFSGHREIENRSISEELARQVCNIMSQFGYLDCDTAASASAALSFDIIEPVCRRKQTYNTEVKVHLLKDDLVPDKIMEEEEKSKGWPIYMIGSRRFVRHLLTTSTSPTYFTKINKYCPCACLSFKDLCAAFKNRSFCRWYYLYYKSTRAALARLL